LHQRSRINRGQAEPCFATERRDPVPYSWSASRRRGLSGWCALAGFALRVRERESTSPRHRRGPLADGVSVSVVPLAAAPVVGLWSKNPWLAIGTGVAPVCLVFLIMAVGFWWNALRVRHRISDFLIRPVQGGMDAEPDDAADGAV
jgi:hypothetical protein